DVDQFETVAAREEVDRDEREVREVLVIDGVELVLGDQTLKVRELERDDALGCQQPLHAGNEIIEVRHLSENVVAYDQVCVLALGDEAVGKRGAEELDEGWHMSAARGLGNVGGRLDAQHGHVERQKVLKQIAVVAGKLDDEAARTEVQPVL